MTPIDLTIQDVVSKRLWRYINNLSHRNQGWWTKRVFEACLAGYFRGIMSDGLIRINHC